MTLEARISELTRQYRPLAIEILKETIRVIESLGLTPDQKEKMYRTNAEKLLKL